MYTVDRPLRMPPVREYAGRMTRANPYHDKGTGQFAHGPGGTGSYGWKPGAWKKRTDIPGRFQEVWENGEHQIKIKQMTGLSDAHVKALRSDVDNLIAKWPPPNGPARVLVVTDREMEQRGKAKDVTGFAFLGESVVTLRASVVADDRPVNTPQQDFNIPQASKHSARTYSLTHEWGHIQDPRQDADRQAIFQETGGAPSEYGRRSDIESYAEAFAEWALSDGKTSYLSVKAYAEHYGWRA